MREIKGTAIKYKKTIIIATHSAEMIELNTVQDLSNLVFFKDRELPKQISLETSELRNVKLNDFLLRMSLTYTEGFFAKKILLIEGSSDMIICRYLSNELGLNLDVAGSQIIPVEGKGQFPVITKLFRLIGKEVCVLTDLDGFIDDNEVINLFSTLPNATEIANCHGNDKLQDMIGAIKTKIEELIRRNKANMTEIYHPHPYWVNRDQKADEDKPIRRALIAKLFTASDEDVLQWPEGEEWKKLKTRITVLFDILEKVGCFVLRKGALESYYSFASDTTYAGKPSAAIIEIRKLQEKENCEAIREQYADIIRALKYAALDENVDESFAIKKELYSELSLVLGILKVESTETELMSVIKQTKGNSKSLFEYEIINENSSIGVKVSLQSTIMDVNGFPFKAFVGDNVNQVIDNNIHLISTL